MFICVFVVDQPRCGSICNILLSAIYFEPFSFYCCVFNHAENDLIFEYLISVFTGIQRWIRRHYSLNEYFSDSALHHQNIVGLMTKDDVLTSIPISGMK